MNTFWTIRKDEFYSISKKELSKFFNSLEKKCLEVHKISKTNKFLAEVYNKDKIIKAKAVFTFHPYYEDCPWLLNRVEYGLPSGDFTKWIKYIFKKYAKTSHFNNNLKSHPCTSFEFYHLLPTVTIDVECKVDDTKVLDKEGSLFDEATYKETKMVYFNYLKVTLDNNDFVLGEKYLDIYSPVSDWLRVIEILTNYTGEFYIPEEIFDILTPVKNWDKLSLGETIHKILKKHILVKQYTR